MWIARDKDGELTLFAAKPCLDDVHEFWYQNENIEFFENPGCLGSAYQRINKNAFPEVTFENSPIELNLNK